MKFTLTYIYKVCQDIHMHNDIEVIFAMREKKQEIY